jgi:hypothetical protein
MQRSSGGGGGLSAPLLLWNSADGAPAEINRAIEKQFVTVNRVLDSDDRENSDGYERIAEADLQEIPSILKDLAANILPPK